MNVIFWQNMLAIHQSAHIRALAAQGDKCVTLVAQEDISADRRAMGWTIPDFGKARVIVQPDDATIQRLVADSPGDSVHIFSGIRPFPMVRKAYYYSRKVSTRRGLLVEAGDHRSFKGLLRRVRGRFEYFQYGHEVEFILAIGSLSIEWYRRCGYPEAKLFPYGYFVETPLTPESHLVRPNEFETIEIMYLGQLIPRKGLDILLQALAPLREARWRLTLMGSGPSEKELRNQAKSLGLGDRICFQVAGSNREAVASIGNADVFVLPSRFDGWGAVVNEALMCGVPVLCSSNCGAADLVREDWRGEVFPAYSVPKLTETLDRWITRGKRTAADTQKIKDWSRCIDGKVASNYLDAVLKLPQAAGCSAHPIPPWHPLETIHHSEALTTPLPGTGANISLW